MEMDVMTDLTLWILCVKQYGGKSGEKNKRQILNLKRFLLELEIVRKMDIGWKKNGLESNVCTSFESVRFCFALLFYLAVFFLWWATVHAMESIEVSPSCLCKNYFRNNINLLLCRWLMPGSLRNFYIFLLSWGKVWICTLFPFSPGEYMMQL